MRKDDIAAAAREVLALDSGGLPRCGDSERILATLCALDELADDDLIDELLTRGFLAHVDDRRHLDIEPRLLPLGGGRFEMGTDADRKRHYCGETPRHSVELSAFRLSEVPVTNKVFALLDPGRLDSPRAAPVIDVTWFDAALFARWVGCRLPTEAEWEYACGASSSHDWCCPESELPRYGWYSENAEREIHSVSTREPNDLGLFDMHGNVWEWCRDDYAADYYGRSPASNPSNDGSVGGTPGNFPVNTHKVSRGGGFLALPEMCRNSYRVHDPAGFHAFDLGFRLAAR